MTGVPKTVYKRAGLDLGVEPLGLAPPHPLNSWYEAPEFVFYQEVSMPNL